MYLIVVNPFGIYSRGDTISDSGIIAQVLSSGYSANVVEVDNTGGGSPSLPNFLDGGSIGLGTGTTSFAELTGPGYSRQSITLGPIFGGKFKNTTSAIFSATGTWPTAKQYGIFDSGGNLLLWWKVDSYFTLTGGQSSNVYIGDIRITAPDLYTLPVSTLIFFQAGSKFGSTIDGRVVTSGEYLQVSSGVLAASALGSAAGMGDVVSVAGRVGAVALSSADISDFSDAAPSAVKYLISDRHSMNECAAAGDGVTDDAATINAFLSTLTSGATVFLPPNKIYLISGANLTVPAGVSIIGANSPLSKNAANTLSGVSGFAVATNRTIAISNQRNHLKNLLIYQQGLPTAPNTAAAIAEVATWQGNGVGLTLTNDGTIVEDCLILGFGTGIYTKTGRFLLKNVWLDNYICVRCESMGDTSYMREVHCEPFWSIVSSDVNTGGWARPGCGLYLDHVGGWIDDLFTFCYAMPVVALGGNNYISNSGVEWHDSYGNGVVGTVGFCNLGHNSTSISNAFAAGDWTRAISYNSCTGAYVSNFSATGNSLVGVHCAGQTSPAKTLTIAGTHTAGDTVTATVTSASISGSPVSVVYTVASGETSATIAKNLCQKINLTQPLITAGVYADYVNAVASVYYPGDMTATVTTSATGTTTSTIGTGAANLGSYGVINGVSVTGTSGPAVSFGNTVTTTLAWTVSGIFPYASSTMLSNWISCPAGVAQQVMLAISGMPSHSQNSTYAYGTVVGNDARGSWIPSSAGTTQTFTFRVAYPWAPSSVQLTTDDPTLIASVSAITAGTFTAKFNASPLGHTIYYRVEL